ncbi:hypothetical protein TOPH_05635 [Tolypocladium ophioglossoides CBS 100239]|uniref:Uncharacterized protein n=1 Tax=Tolypocladium ophioglossoides (strain CBS 100239) TaxID=1163406 RepID=A0A0L0N6E7_TOLOC|nr:hypothetical protein TOPH_05635 [Tolypocladium ophioglossoides CBS 100239]
MASAEQLFVALLRSDRIAGCLAAHLPAASLCAVRAASSACCNLLTKRLFTRLHVTFTPTALTRPCRAAALARVGHHVEHLTFYMPHSDATFLPPLVHPLTGQEICFLYSPHTSVGSVLTRPKYANTELGEMLTQQYPPLFHAATNVPSFINALRQLPNLRHLTIRCPGQDPRERYRRDIVDYALISLRIAVERAPVTKLAKLSLSSLHPSAFNYLRHLPGIGCVPSAGRRWRQIKKLSMSVEAWDFYGPSPGLDHLKIIDDYIRCFAPCLEKFAFAWVGPKGPCPIALSADPLFAPPRASRKLFHEVTSPMSPLPTRPSRAPIHFPRLRHLQMRNASMNAPQLSGLINAHRATVREFDFEDVVLRDHGSWDDALAPLSRDDAWARSSVLAETSECGSFVASDGGEALPSPSAAVAAASRELLDVDLGRFGFSHGESEVIEGLSEEVAAAREEAMSITTRFRKRRGRRRRRKHHGDEDEQAAEPRPSTSSSSSSSSPPRRRKLSGTIRPPTPLPQSTITAPILRSDPHPVLLQPTVYDPSARHAPDDGISSVQRNIEQEEAHRLLAEDAAARVSALQRAKAVVLSKLSREFCTKRSRAGAGAVAACRLMAGRDFGGCGMEVLEDRRVLQSRSALVPLMFSRS